MSELSEHLATWGLDGQIGEILAEAGIELLADARDLDQDDLEGLGCTAAQAIALRHSFGHGGEGAAAVASAVATMNLGVAAASSKTTASTSDQDARTRRTSYGDSELEVHLHQHSLQGLAGQLLESGITFLSEVRALEWSDLHAMGLSKEDASTLRDSLDLDSTPPDGIWPDGESDEAPPLYLQRKRCSVVEEFNALKAEDRSQSLQKGGFNKDRPPRRTVAQGRSRAVSADARNTSFGSNPSFGPGRDRAMSK